MDGDYDNNRRVYRSAPTPKNSNRWPRLKRKGCQWDAEAHEGGLDRWWRRRDLGMWGQATDMEREKERKKALLTEGDRKIKKDTHLQHFEVS